MTTAADRLKIADEALMLCKIASRKTGSSQVEYQARAIRTIAELERVDTTEFKKLLGMEKWDFDACLRLARVLLSSKSKNSRNFDGYVKMSAVMSEIVRQFKEYPEVAP